MLSGVCLGTNDLQLAGQFYDLVLSTIGMRRCAENDMEIGFARNVDIDNHKNDISESAEQLSFWILKPYDDKPASFGNGTQVMFTAASENEVRQFHAVALSLGGVDEGAPGPRDYSAGYYGAYCRDLDGNKIHVFYKNEH